jgi:hypothetical protein
MGGGSAGEESQRSVVGMREEFLGGKLQCAYEYDEYPRWA